jgi:hypothetical protein
LEDRDLTVDIRTCQSAELDGRPNGLPIDDQQPRVARLAEVLTREELAVAPAPHVPEGVRQARLVRQTGLAAEQTLLELEALGFTPHTMVLLELIPLLHVAWAEGGVSSRERAYILDSARQRGIEPGSAADLQLLDWMATRPSEDFFERSLHVLATLLQARPLRGRLIGRQRLRSSSRGAAAASGGMLGFGNMSSAEQEVLTRIDERLDDGR